MKYNKLLILLLSLILTSNVINCQVNDDKFKRFSMSVVFGNGKILNDPVVPASPNSTDWIVSGEAPQITSIQDENNISNMIGAEFRYFFSKNIAMKIYGNGNYSNTPAQDNIQGITPTTSGAIDPLSPNAGWIPNYDATIMDNLLSGTAAIGIEYHFNPFLKVSPYFGLMIPGTYTRRSLYDPTVTINMLNPALNDAVKITDVGTRHIEQIGFGGQIVFGADYNVTESLFFGFEIKPLTYIYAFNTKYPAPGLESRSADTHFIGFLTHPVFKIGFKL